MHIFDAIVGNGDRLALVRGLRRVIRGVFDKGTYGDADGKPICGSRSDAALIRLSEN